MNRITQLIVLTACVAGCDAGVEGSGESHRAAEATVAAPTASREALTSLQPRTTRAGTLRFTGPMVRTEVATEVFLQRLGSGAESVPTRIALADALPRTAGEYGEALVALMAEEPDASVRATMVASLRTAGATPALAGLRNALSDDDARVRAAAARTAARRPDGDTLREPLLRAASDTDAEVKVAAMRSLGVLGVSEAQTLLGAELSATDAEVRLAAVRALHRIDPAHAKILPGVIALAGDSDARVSKAAAKALAARP